MSNALFVIFTKKDRSKAKPGYFLGLYCSIIKANYLGAAACVVGIVKCQLSWWRKSKLKTGGV